MHVCIHAIASHMVTSSQLTDAIQMNNKTPTHLTKMGMQRLANTGSNSSCMHAYIHTWLTQSVWPLMCVCVCVCVVLYHIMGVFALQKQQCLELMYYTIFSIRM